MLPSPVGSPLFQPPILPEPIAARAVDRLLEKDLDCLSETPALLASNTQTFCDDQQLPTDQARMRSRRKEIDQANQDKKARAKRLHPLLPATRSAPASQALKAAIRTEASSLSSRLQTLQEGQSLLFAGSYGETRSLQETLLPISRLLFSRNPGALPPLLREAFQKGTPTAETVVHTLFSIVDARGAAWPEDPAAKRILHLILLANDDQNRQGLIQCIHRIRELPPQQHYPALLEHYPGIIPQDFSRDDLLKALVPAENNILHSLMQLIAAPNIAAHFADPATAPTTIEAVINLLLKETYEHGHQQVSGDQKRLLAETLGTFATQWKDPALIQRLETLKQKQAEGAESFMQELGRVVLELAGEKQTDFSRFLRTCMDEELETTCRELLHTLPPDVSAFLEESLLSPAGEYFVKCIRRGHAYDVEIYASGPLLHDPLFAGKWPLVFSQLPKECLTTSFFTGLIQHTLSLQETAPFSSSPAHFKQFLLAALGEPNAMLSNSHVLSRSRLSSTEMAFHYLSHDPEARPDHQQSPVFKRLIWQYEKLRHVIQAHTRDGTLDFGTPDRAKAIQAAAMRIFHAAEGLKTTCPELATSLQRIQTTCQTAKAACVETQQRRIREAFASEAGAQVPVHLPHALKIRLRKPVAKLKQTLEKIAHISRTVPFASSWIQASRRVLLQKIFALSSGDASQLYALLEAQFPTMPSAAPTPTPAPLPSRLSTLLSVLHRIVKGIQWTLNILSKFFTLCLSVLFLHLPTRLQHGFTALSQMFTHTIQAIQQRLIEKLVDRLIARYFDPEHLHALMAFGKAFVTSMHTHPPLTFNVPAGMMDGQHTALEFGSQLLPLREFASLDTIQVIVERGEITCLILGPAGPFYLQHGNDASYFVHDIHGTLCLQQHHPKLAAFHPYLLVEDPDGSPHVLLRESLIANQAMDFSAEQALGTFLWNGVKPLIPQSTKQNVLYTCQLTETHLSAPSPEALLYITRSYLIHEQHEAALAAYHEFERRVQENPNFSITLSHVIPFLLCSHPMAPKIRLSLCAHLEQQRMRNPNVAMWQSHPLHGFLWMFLCADFHQIERTLDDPQFPHLKKHIPSLRHMMVERMQEQLPFYTTQELAECMKQWLHLQGEVSGEGLKALLGSSHLQPELIRLAAPFLLPPAIQGVGASHAFSAFKKVMKEVIYSTVPEVGFAAQGMARLFNQADLPKHLPLLVRQLLQHTELSKREETDLKNALAHVLRLSAEAESDYLLDPSSLPPLSAASLKSHFWSYYALLYSDREHQNRAAQSIQLPLVLLQQELKDDREAAVLARILMVLLKVTQEKKGHYLKRLHADPDAFSPRKLQQTLQDDGVDVLITRFKTLMTEPETLLPRMIRIRKAIQTALHCMIGGAGYTMKAVTYTTETIPHHIGQVKHGIGQVKRGVGQQARSLKEGMRHQAHNVAKGISGIAQNLMRMSNVFAPTRSITEEAPEEVPEDAPHLMDDDVD